MRVLMRHVDLKHTDEQALARARDAKANAGVMYRVGDGGTNPTAAHCATIRQGVLTADCVGALMYWLGVDRQYAPGAWDNQNSMYANARDGGKRWRFCTTPHPGAVGLIRGPLAKDDPKTGQKATRLAGHVVLLDHVELVDGRIDIRKSTAWHCSPSNHRRVGQGIALTSVKTALGVNRPHYYVERVPA